MTAVAFDPFRPRLVTGSQAGPLSVWDLARRSLLCDIRGHSDEVASIVFSPDGKSPADGKPRWDRPILGCGIGPATWSSAPSHGRRPLRNLPPRPGRSVVTGTKDGLIHRWQVPLLPWMEPSIKSA